MDIARVGFSQDIVLAGREYDFPPVFRLKLPAREPAARLAGDEFAVGRQSIALGGRDRETEISRDGIAPVGLRVVRVPEAPVPAVFVADGELGVEIRQVYLPVPVRAEQPGTLRYAQFAGKVHRRRPAAFERRRQRHAAELIIPAELIFQRLSIRAGDGRDGQLCVLRRKAVRPELEPQLFRGVVAAVAHRDALRECEPLRLRLQHGVNGVLCAQVQRLRLFPAAAGEEQHRKKRSNCRVQSLSHPDTPFTHETAVPVHCSRRRFYPSSTLTSRPKRSSVTLSGA